MLPTSRNRTYVDGTPVNPGDLNDLQDMVIGGKSPSFTHWQSLQSIGNVQTNVASGHISGAGVATTAANAIITNPCLIDLKAGDRITDISILLHPSAGPQTFRLYLYSLRIEAGPAIGFTSLQLEIVDPAAVVAKFNKTNAVLTGGPLVVAADNAFHWRVEFGNQAAASKAYGVAITKDRL